MTKIIVELCQNHLGRRELLGRMIEAAAAAGADYVKGQVIFSEDLTCRERFEQGQIEDNGVVKTIKRPYQAEFDRLKQLDLSEDDYRWFVDRAAAAGVAPLLTIFSRRRIDFASKLPWPERVVKVASYDCASHAMIKELCDAFDHLIISVGASYDEEIERTAEIVKAKGKKLTFLHCVTSYPNGLEMCNLARMNWLKKFTPSVGWSDHTLVKRDGLIAAQTAALLGADFIERHFTVLAADETKDGPVSISPAQLKELKDFTRLEPAGQRRLMEKVDWQKLVGNELRELTHKEILNRDYYRGRFASRLGREWVYNWQDKSIK